ncbi:MAG: ComEA family DNA-binding protein [Deltaproteobacteria bacterium]|nr:MAG: ComEA family DNA-binding protein [Deltaproteobacteria bacterium]
MTRVPGIGPATLNNLRPLATVGNGDDAPPAEQPVPAPGASPGASAPGGAAAPPGPAARPPAARALDDIDLDESPDAGDVDRPTDVASAPAPQAGAAPQATGDQINLNTASAADLQRLPGIGATRAAAIISDRDLNGPFRSVDDITRVSGVGPATLNNIRGLVTVGE